MSLRFYFGPSGSGKSRQLCSELIERAADNIHKNYLYIVPDQFTMQTQKDIVTLNNRGGILNIDVLSFSRLGHRILEEVGRRNLPVLDDTGKSLILQCVANDLKDEMDTLGPLMSKQGYIHEAKSAISEFMQYGLSYDDVNSLVDFSKKRGALSSKLKDLNVLYKGFREYIHERYITTEETLDVLTRSIGNSKILKGSVVVFDGFTGFTPIQYRVIEELLVYCDEVIISLVMGDGEDPYELGGEQNLFYLSKKTVADLERICLSARIDRGKDIFVHSSVDRFESAKAIRHLERNIFKLKQKVQESNGEVRIFEAVTPADEIHQTALYIAELIRNDKLEYRDIAVICGNLSQYGNIVKTEFNKMDIPCYIDKSNGIVMNPMIEAIRSVFQVFISDFSFEAVFHLLKSGMLDISMEDVDKLENYCIKTGISGRRRWTNMFTRKAASGGAGDNLEYEIEKEKELENLNNTRNLFVEAISQLDIGLKATAGEYVNALYDFLVANRIEEKLYAYERSFKESLSLEKAKEYSQIYKLIIKLLEQINSLLADKEISMQEFLDILEAGFQEIEVGTIPQNVDRVLVGDMERTRLKQVKVLFFVGVNDGNIPKSASKGGIISDIDREFLKESGIELAPTPRQQMFIQRLYLYLNLTKPSHNLFISFCKIDNEGKSMRPSYLIDSIRNLFTDIRVEYPQNRSVLEQIENKKAGSKYLAEGIRDYVLGVMPEEKHSEFLTIYKAFSGEENRNVLLNAAQKSYRNSGLAREIARALYGIRLENSVTRLESFSACAYKHFLKYGLELKEREEFQFENVDMGIIYHGVLERFSNELKEKGYTWFDFPDEFANSAINDALEDYAATYGDTILYSTARNTYALKRMSRILLRTVLTLKQQLNKGTFVPEGYEVSFGYAKDLDCVNISLSEDERMHLKGRIDRLDTDMDEENVYVKVIDYKSGNKHFDLAALYHGLQLQLVLYMNVAVEIEKKKHPDKNVIPAAILYYHIDDPTVDAADALTDDEINQKIIEKLKMTGKINSEMGIVQRLDKYMDDKSDILPVEIKKDGTFSSRSQVLSGEELQVISNYVNKKVKDIGRNIVSGDISVNPYEDGDKGSCNYCPYKKVCGFDPTIPGYNKRQLGTVDGSKDETEIINKMRKDLEVEN